MSEATTLGMWILLTVTGNGQVSTASLPTEAACEDAISVVLTGMTRVEAKAASDAYARQQQEAEAAWLKANPPRKPKDDLERTEVSHVRAAKDATFPVWIGETCGAVCESKSVTQDFKIQDNYVDPFSRSGLTYDPSHGEFVTYGVTGQPVLREGGDVKTARCFLSPDSRFDDHTSKAAPK